jgi:hypothetical protein
MKTEDYPLWVAGRLPTGLSGNVAASVASAIPTHKFKQGKKCSRKAKNDERKVIMRNFINQLDLALVDRARELESVHAAQAIPKPLATLILDFFSVVIQVSDGTKNQRGKAPPTTLKSAKGLNQPLQSFKVSVDAFVPASTTSPALHDILNELIADVVHFIQQIRMTHSIVTVVDKKPLIRNRPTKLDARVKFAELVGEYQRVNRTEKFPKCRNLLAQLKIMGHIISARTFRDWRAQMQNGTFWHFVQNRKRQ